MNVEGLEAILKSVKEVIKCLEYKTTSFVDCFLHLVKLTLLIKSLSDSTSSFCKQYIVIFNKRWNQSDINLYMVAYLLYPLYRGMYFFFYFV